MYSGTFQTLEIKKIPRFVSGDLYSQHVGNYFLPSSFFGAAAFFASAAAGAAAAPSAGAAAASSAAILAARGTSTTATDACLGSANSSLSTLMSPTLMA